MPPKKRKRKRTGCGYRKKALLAKQRRARETPEETERRRSAEAARKRRIRAAESHEETELRRKIQAEMVARRRQREKDKKRLEYKKMMAASIASFLEEEKERKKAGQEVKEQRKARNANGAASLKSKKAIKFIELHSPQNQQLCHESWDTMIPNAVQTVSPNHGVKENAVKPNIDSILPPNIAETTAITRPPLVDFGYRSIPVNKLHLWEQAEMCKNVRGGQSNNLRAQLQCQNVAETVQFQMNCLRHIYEQFNYGVKFQNNCKNQLKSFTTVVEPEKDDPLQIKMEYAADPSEQFENLEQFENSCEEQPINSITGIHPEKDETVHIKTEYITDSNEQFEKVEELKNGCEGHSNSSITGVHPEKDENVQVKMRFAVGSIEQIKNVEPWNMFTVEFSTPNINIETQNDVAAPISVSSSISDTRNLSKPNLCVPASYPFENMSKSEYLTNSIVQLDKVEKLNVCGTGDHPNHSSKRGKTRKTDAERAKAYRLRKKAQKPKRPPPKTVAERVKKHKDRKRAEKAAIKCIMEAGYEPQAKQINFLQNQQLCQQNSWSRLIPNSDPTVSPSYRVKENSVKPNNVAILPPNITESTAITRAPLVEFGYRSIPVNKLHLWEQDEMYRNVQGGQSNNLRYHKMECATVLSKQFENVEQLKNGCEEQPRSSITSVNPEKNETVHIQMEYVTDSSEQYEKAEELKDGCEEQSSCSRTGVHPEKDENVNVKMKLAVGSSEQIENIEPWNMFTVDFLTPNINIEIQNDVTAPISVSGSASDTKNLSKTNLYISASYPPANMSKAECLTNSIVQLEKVEKLNVCGAGDCLNNSGTEILPEKDENIKIKLEFAEDASVHVEPWDL